MKRLVQLLRFPEIHSILVMNYVFDELVCAFKDYDCEIAIVNNIDELRNEGIIFLDNGISVVNKNIDVINKIANKCPDALYYLWYWIDHSNFSLLNYIPFKYVIHIGNHTLKVPTLPNLINQHNNYNTLPNYCPFKFRANESPELVGTYERNILRDYCFMGAPYRSDWVPYEFNGIYYGTDWNKYLKYEQRKEIYLSSIFALGFHGNEPIDCGSISQRVFEGMAYGCIVLSDNPIAETLTEGIVVTVTSKEDVIQKINYFKQNPELIIEKQNKGYEWVKKYGTNRESIRVLLNKAKEVYNLEFE